MQKYSQRAGIIPKKDSGFFSDIYHFFLVSRWLTLFVFLAGGCLGLSALFAFLYVLGGDTIANARVGSFEDAFYFSTQTLSTLGFGYFHPKGRYASMLAALEAFTGLMGFAMASGLMFAKFSRPTAKVIFSSTAVITPRNGIPTLMFRMANGRSSQILEAQLSVALVRTETSQEGEKMRRLHDLPLIRNHSPMFGLTWTAEHPISETSPLWGKKPEDLANEKMEIFLIFTGLEATFSQTVHARHRYGNEEIQWNRRFADILTLDSSLRARIDHTKFHDTLPI